MEGFFENKILPKDLEELKKRGDKYRSESQLKDMIVNNTSLSRLNLPFHHF